MIHRIDDRFQHYGQRLIQCADRVEAFRFAALLQSTVGRSLQVEIVEELPMDRERTRNCVGIRSYDRSRIADALQMARELWDGGER